MLCGISDCFRSLFRSKGQVPHALLTRPPLTQDRSPLSVRLECVRHAASVHPEPGSNSRNVCILSHLSELKSWFRALIALYCFFEYFYSQVRINEIPYTIPSCDALYLISCCSIFNDRCFPLEGSLSATAWLLYHAFPLLSTLFLKVFSFCIKFQKLLPCLTAKKAFCTTKHLLHSLSVLINNILPTN